MSAPDMGSMAVTNALNPAETTTSDVPNQIPMPDAPPQTAPDPAVQAANAPEPPPAAKPSLWRGVLAGALQGLAAGSAVNTKGMGNGGAFAAGAGAGANQVLNVQPQQKAALDEAKMSTALHYAELGKVQRELNNMPDSRREMLLDQATDHTDTMFKSGAVTPLTPPSDLKDAQSKVQEMHAKQPWAVYSLLPTRGADGTVKYAAVQYNKSPIQEDVTLKGAGANGEDITYKAGTVTGEDVGKAMTQMMGKKIDASNKQSLSDSKAADRSALQTQKDTADMARVRLRIDAKAKETIAKAADMSFATLPDGSQAVASAAELNARGLKPLKLPGTEGQKVYVARQLVGPQKGLFDLVQKDIDELDKQGKLGVLASRANNFWTSDVGSGPEFAKLKSHMGLLTTALMQAHVGARGSKDMLEHFYELTPYKITDAATLRSALGAEWQYVNEKASWLPGTPNAGRTAAGQPSNAGAASASTSTGSGKAVSLAAAKQLPAMKGKTDDEIKAAITAQGHTVTN